MASSGWSLRGRFDDGSLPASSGSSQSAELSGGKIESEVGGTSSTIISESEFPALFEKGLQLALFRTYGIPSISRLLVQTAQLSTSENVAKRYADTTVLICEIYANSPTGPRGIEAFARLNYLHGHYLAAKRISNDDMLYTLALFMNSPVEWINKYEWRKLTPLEQCAIATFHKSMGEAMQISFAQRDG